MRFVWRAVAALFLLSVSFECMVFAAEYTPGGLLRNQSLYVSMRDGVKLAVDLWLPADLAPDRKVPALLKLTSYWRAVGLAETTATFRVLSALSMAPNEDFNKPEADRFSKAGYALVYVDARGTGASYGTRSHPFSETELEDYREIVDWVIAQPWSNGRVGALGSSYEGTAAELLTTRGHPAVKAVAPQFSDFDPWQHLVAPGGVLNEWFIRYWRDGTRMLDANDLKAVAKFKGFEYELFKRIVTGVKRVAEDKNGAMLAAAVGMRTDTPDVYTAARQCEFCDDPFGAGPPFASFSAYGMRDSIEASNVPMMVWAGWFDAATVLGALSRYMTFRNPQWVVIGPWGHGGKHDANPFLPPDAAAQPTRQTRDAELAAFFDGYLKDPSIAAPSRLIRYYTMGEDKWKTADLWPPPGVSMRRMYFAADRTLSPDPPSDTDASDSYTVDFAATTGDANRWRTQADGADVIYPDRAAQDAKLLTYTSAPLDKDLEITGSPVVTLYASSTATDGAFYAYLEVVGSDNKVTYLTEGMLRAVHRAISDEQPPYAIFGPYHSFKRKDARPLTPGEVVQIAFDLVPTSVLLRQGSRIRIALAGHDASCFARYPASGTPTITVSRSSGLASCVDLPVVAR